jgi:hypothetical protein
MSVRNLVEEFSALKDPRCGGKVEHRLIDTLAIAVCAVIAGAESWEGFQLFMTAATRIGWVRFWRCRTASRPMIPSGACSC